MKFIDENGNSRQVNSVLRCLSNECRTVIDRDVNGCINILFIFVTLLRGLERPVQFKRDVKYLLPEERGQSVENRNTVVNRTITEVPRNLL